MAAPTTSSVDFDGVVGFVDLAGFTAATERFSSAGAAGTEALGRVINSLFTPAIELVHDAGGEIGWFAGDAIGVVFDRSVTSAGNALSSLAALSRTLTALTPIHTQHGVVDLGVKVGVAAGPVRWRSLVRTSTLAWFSGRAVDDAASAEHHAVAGHLVAHSSVLGLVDGRPEPLEDFGGGFVRLDPRDFADPEPVGARPLESRRAVDHQPPRVARLARAGDIALLDQHRPVTSVFFRLPDTTVDPELLDQIADVVEEFGGVLQTTTEGDKGATALALFGVPTALADRHRRAVVAATALRAEHPGLACGIASGRVFAGRVGSDARWDYSVLGERVNIAARLMQAAAAGEILVDNATMAAAGSGILAGESRYLALKGVAEPEEVAVVMSVMERAALDVGGPFVGREDELQQLAAALGRPGLTVVSGAPGIGKSRLLQRAIHDAGTEVADGSRLLRIAAAETDRVRPFRSLRRVLAHCDVQTAAAANPIVGEHRAPLVDLVMGRPVGDSPLLENLDDDDRAELIAGVIVEIVAAHGVATLVIEDLHAVDGQSIDHLARSVGRYAEAGIAVVVTTRPDARASAAVEAPGAAILELTELDDDALGRLVGILWTEALGSPPVAALVDDVVTRASGSPLFCQQLIALAAASGRPADAESIDDEVPTSIEDLMQARLDAVPAEADPVVGYGSVVNEPFTNAELLEAFGGRPGAHLIPGSVEILLDRSVLTGFREHRFAHGLLREVAYHRLNFDLRKELHAAALAMLEKRGTAEAGELARHAAETDDKDRQRRHFAAAAEEAAAHYANDIARSWYQRLLPLLHGAEAGRIRLALGRLEFIAGELDVASVLLADSVDDLPEGTAEQADALLALGRVEIAMGDSAGFDRIEQVLEAAETRGDWDVVREALEAAAYVGVMFGDVERAERVERSLVELAGRLGPEHEVAQPIAYLHGLLWLRGDLVAAATAYEREYANSLAEGDLVHAGFWASDLGGIHYEQGDVVAALAWLERGRECFERVGHERAIVRCIRANEAFIRCDLHDLDGGWALGLAAADRALSLGDLATVVGILVGIAASAPTPVDSLLALDAAAEGAERLGVEAVVEEIVLSRARVHGAAGDFDAALTTVRDVMANAGPDVAPAMAAETATWRLLDGGSASDAVAVFRALDNGETPPAVLFPLADALARVEESTDWSGVAASLAHEIVDAGAPPSLSGRLAFYDVELPPPPPFAAPPLSAAVDLSLLVDRFRGALPQPHGASVLS